MSGEGDNEATMSESNIDGSSLKIKIKLGQNKSVTTVKKEETPNEMKVSKKISNKTGEHNSNEQTTSSKKKSQSSKNNSTSKSKGTRKKGGGNNKSRPKSRRKSTRNKKSQRQLAEASEQTDEELTQAYSNYSANFWKNVEDYFNPINEFEVEFCAPENCKELRDDDPYLLIPKKGKHYSLVWEEEEKNLEKEIDTKNIKLSTNDIKPDLHCQDITARILSALVEESIVPSGFGNRVNGSKKMKHEMDMNNPICDNISMDLLNNIEERIKNELKNLKLFSDNMIIDQVPEVKPEPIIEDDDDEICKELRILQQQLKEQNRINCQKKRQLYPQLQKLREDQVKEQKQIEDLYRNEEEYHKELRNIKRKRNNEDTSGKATKKKKQE